MLRGAIGNLTVACFAAGTPLVVDFEGNSRSIEDIEVGDYVLARSEFDAAGPLELKRVEEKFVRVAPVMELVVRGQVITTTAEHPFYVAGEERFVPAGELTLEDQLVASQGRPIAIEAIRVTDRLITVYNLRVADFHTYFVGGKLWQFDAWVHNAGYRKIVGDAPRSGVDLELTYKPGWTEAQRAAARQKVQALTEADTVVIRSPQRSGTAASSRYKQAGNTVPSGHDVDHVIDLQLGGADDILNMNPVDASVNRSLGSQIQHRIKDLPAGTRVNRVTITSRPGEE